MSGAYLTVKRKRNMTKEQMQALFLLAGINILAYWELPNNYWPDSYVELRKNSPWWLVKTTKGMVRIGWRKRVISIHWEDTDIRQVITEDDVTKDETMVHAWSYLKALEYLTKLAVAINKPVTPKEDES